MWHLKAHISGAQPGEEDAWFDRADQALDWMRALTASHGQTVVPLPTAWCDTLSGGVLDASGVEVGTYGVVFWPGTQPCAS